MMKRVEEKLAEEKSTKNPNLTGQAGLLARTKLPTGSLSATSEDVSVEIAAYIKSIRQAKEDVIRGKS